MPDIMRRARRPCNPAARGGRGLPQTGEIDYA